MTLRRFIPALVLLAVIVAGWFLVPSPDAAWAVAREHLTEWQAAVADNPIPAALAFVAVYVTATALSLPIASWLSLIGGALFGRWVGTGLVSVAATTGATLAFLAARYLFRDAVQRRFGARLHKLNAGVARDGAFYLLTLRLIPAVPFFLINLGMALTPIRTRTFAATSFVGMLPGCFLFVNAGTAAASVQSPRDVLSLEVLLSLAALGLLPLLVKWAVRRRTMPA